MFETSMLPPPAPRRAMPLAYLIEGVLVILLALLPLIRTQALPNASNGIFYIPAPPPRLAAAQPHAIRRIVGAPLQRGITAPAAIPRLVAQLPEQPGAAVEPPEIAIPGSVPWGDPHGLAEGAGLPVPPPPARREPSATRLHVGGAVEAARLLFQPQPEYPEIAHAARVQGTVRLAAVINTDGAIGSLQALSGPPLLVRAALNAVARWRYRPTLLNGEPVEVSTEIEVNFVLDAP